MIVPTPAEVSALRVDCAKRFGAARMLLVKLAEPIGASLVMAAFDLKSFSAHVDNRQGNVLTSAGVAVVDRLLWCSPQDATEPTVDALVPGPTDADPLHNVALTRLEALREAWPAVDGKISNELHLAAGGGLGTLTARPLTAGNTPAGFSSPDAPAAGPGSLWLAAFPDPGSVALVMRQPLPDVWTAAKAGWNDALAASRGLVSASLAFAREHVVFSGRESLDVLLDRQPDLGLRLIHPFLEMGGAGAASSASFL